MHSAIVISVVMFSAKMQSDIMLNAVKLSVVLNMVLLSSCIMLSVVFANFHDEKCRYIVCHRGESQGAKRENI